MNQPAINVAPLIDVLLVLLIIFMVVAPLKPSAIKARIPDEPKSVEKLEPHPDTLVVAISPSGDLSVNELTDLGSVDDTSKVIGRLRHIFELRKANGNVSLRFADDRDRKTSDRIERTVFIKAPRTLDYGKVTRVTDAVKVAGAFPVSLQIDHLNN